MTGRLEELQKRLEKHFESLARDRGDAGLPVFALEHGLNEIELQQISGIVRSYPKEQLPLSLHWLLWVVYATEHGYSYTGDEYWPSFEKQTPKWEFSDRNFITRWFRKFQKSYHGVIPSGPWADHFRIIAWPITHAILPRYLQRHFARALYDLRFRLASLTNPDPCRIGRLLAANAHYAPKRFQEFLQQEELSGRIVLAFLGAEPSPGNELIYPTTLQRIASDLEQVRNAQEWLKETQRVVSDRFKGIGRGSGPPAPRPSPEPGEPSVPDTTHLSIRPNLLLRHTGGGIWSVLLEVPSFRDVAALSPDMQSFLQRTRCHLNGGDGPKPTGWLLSGNRKGVLRAWPDPDQPLIQFKHSQPVLDLLLDECRLSRGPIWLFKIGSDGMAHEITGRVVRPGRSYIVATIGELPQAHASVCTCKLDCEGVKSFRLAIPPDVSAEMTEWLHGLDLQVARTIRVWPAGLPGRGWDGEGSSEWLTTESPCFGLAHDHPVENYTIQLNNGPDTHIRTGDPGHPVFVRIAPMPAGTHLLTIKARRSPSLDAVASTPPAEGFAQLNVREPEPWTPGVAAHPGLIVTVDPHDPDLDTFWRNEVRLSVFGPEGYTVTCTVRLQAADGREILSEQICAPMNLPITPKIWEKSFNQFLKNEKRTWSYLEAASGILTIEGETLGRYSLRCEHDALPLRWMPRKIHNDIILRLVDDSGQDETKPKVGFHSMKCPLKTAALAVDKAMSGMVVTPPGGLYVAKHGKYSDALVVSTGLTVDNFQDLSVRPTFNGLTNRSVSIAEALRFFSLWYEARLSGPLAKVRHKQVINGFRHAVFSALYGQKWITAEEQIKKYPESMHALGFLKGEVNKHISFPKTIIREKRGGGIVRKPFSFAEMLAKNYSKMDRNASRGVLWFCNVASQFKIPKGRNLCEFALRLASQPHCLPEAYGSDLDRLLKEITNVPAILRGARLLAVISACKNDDATHSWLPRWKWQSIA